MSEYIGFDELTENPAMETAEVETKAGTVKLRALDALGMIEWMDDNDDESKSKISRMLLVARSIVDPKTGACVGDGVDSKDERDQLVATAANKLLRRDAKDMGKMVLACLQLNGLRERNLDVLKNASGGPGSSDSPSGSPSQPAA